MLARILTGNDYEKERSILNAFLKDFLGEEKGKSIDAFPSDFFDALFRMKGWSWEQATTKKLPLIGNYLNNYVYSRLSTDVLVDKKGNLIPELREYLNMLRAFAMASGYNWTNWSRLIERAFPKIELNDI